MIHYQLRCGQGHEFDGWYKDSAAFDDLARRELLECPHCGDQSVTRALMAPALAKRETPAIVEPTPQPVPVPPSAKPSVEPGGVPKKLPDGMRAMLQRLRAEVERHCDYVGDRFADEALRIHRGESAKRSIYGETTPEQAEALAEEGVNFTSIPWVSPAES
jgi:hypothetical protein